jgi:hypothetical protein
MTSPAKINRPFLLNNSLPDDESKELLKLIPHNEPATSHQFILPSRTLIEPIWYDEIFVSFLCFSPTFPHSIRVQHHKLPFLSIKCDALCVLFLYLFPCVYLEIVLNVQYANCVNVEIWYCCGVVHVLEGRCAQACVRTCVRLFTRIMSSCVMSIQCDLEQTCYYPP